ncbi:MAG: LysR family transcriptional regulator [Pseudomonadota bacterium]
MTIEQLRTFLWVARLGGFRKASQRLFLSQPAVSTRIANHEDELGTKLFNRSSGAFQCTKMGQQLPGYTEQMLFVEEEITHRVANPAETEESFFG